MFRIHKKPLKDKYERLRGQAKVRNLSSEGCLRLEWIIAYQKGNKVKDICEQFGISKSTFYKWNDRFQAHNIRSLETLPTTPKKFRSRVMDPVKDERVITLRKEFPYYGKMKLKVIYKQRYKEDISSWYIQKVIEDYNLYPPRRKHKGTTQKPFSYTKKAKIHKFTLPVNKCGFLVHLDTIELRINGKPRYIITAVDSFTRIAFAYAYSSHSSLTAQDFLFKLHHFFAETLVHIHTDNGSEFAGEFDNALKKLNLKHWFSRVRTCNDNAKCERFNRTLQDEITLKFGYPKDISQFNVILMQWLFEYLSIRPHQSLDYLTPLQFLSTISSSSTLACSKKKGIIR